MELGFLTLDQANQDSSLIVDPSLWEGFGALFNSSEIKNKSPEFGH